MSKDEKVIAALVIVASVLLFAGVAGFQWWLYGDWTCIFAKCVIVK